MSTTLDCLNQDVLDVIRTLQDGSDPDLLKDIVTLYLDSSRDLLDRLRHACDDPVEPELVRTLAHSLKGSSATVGAERLAAACASLESRTLTGTTDGIVEALCAVRSEHAQACEALAVELNTGHRAA